MVSSLRSTFAALVLAACVSAADLSLKVSGPTSVDGVHNLKITTTLTNTGSEAVKVLNDPRGPLSTIPADTFTLTTADGTQAAFTGVKAKYVPARAAELGAVTVIAPGQSVSVEHDLSAAYNLTLSGEGQYDIEANNLFHVVDANNAIVPVYAEAEAHSAKVQGKLAVAPSTLAKRISYNGCSSSQQSQLVTAASNAQSYAAGAYSYASSHTSASSRYTTWFGTYTDSRHSTIVSHYNKMSNSNTYSSYTYDCTCTDSGTYAYVYPGTYATVYLCGAFWSAPATGTDSKAGTLVHESSHFTVMAGTDDWVYGQAGAKSLAISNPDHAVDNADSHEYFAENTPSLS